MIIDTLIWEGCTAQWCTILCATTPSVSVWFFGSFQLVNSIQKRDDVDYDKYIEGKKEWWKIILNHLRPYVAAGGKIALGTDCGCSPMLYSNAPDELIIYKELGLTPFQIIQAGTINAAIAIGIEAKTGTLEKGKWADIIVIDGNPLEDLMALKRVKMVILDGDMVVDKR